MTSSGVILGDCRAVLPTLARASAHALITDPPGGLVLTDIDRRGAGNYHLYSGDLARAAPRLGAHKGNLKEHRRARDLFVAFTTEIFALCLPVLRPGAFGLVWAVPKTSHWTAYALEEAGFEVRDVISHVFDGGNFRGTARGDVPDEAPGCNTTLVPGVEHWILVRKPPSGTLRRNFAEYGTGLLDNGAWLAPSGSAAKNVLVSGLPSGLDGVADRFSLVVYEPKAPRSERFYLCRSCNVVSNQSDSLHRGHELEHHPTPKAVGLMRKLLRLVARPGAVVLDPFAGTGTTGVAASAEACGFLGIEENANYVRIANHRLAMLTGSNAK